MIQGRLRKKYISILKTENTLKPRKRKDFRSIQLLNMSLLGFTPKYFLQKYPDSLLLEFKRVILQLGCFTPGSLHFISKLTITPNLTFQFTLPPYLTLHCQKLSM